MLKQVLISDHFSVFGSYMESWRPDTGIGATLADGWSEPCLQKAGFSSGRSFAVNHTRPFSSIMGLWIEVWLSQIGSSPQYTDGPMVFSLVDGVLGSR